MTIKTNVSEEASCRVTVHVQFFHGSHDSIGNLHAGAIEGVEALLLAIHTNKGGGLGAAHVAGLEEGACSFERPVGVGKGLRALGHPLAVLSAQGERLIARLSGRVDGAVEQYSGEALLVRRPAPRVGVEALPAVVGRAGAWLDVVVGRAGVVDDIAGNEQ